MVDILLVHPDTALREALKQTLQSVWSEPVYADCAPDMAADLIAAQSPALFIAPAADIAPELTRAPQFMALDDHLPTRLHVLLNRIETRLHTPHAPQILQIGDAVLETRSREWQVQDMRIALTEKEVDTLVYLSQTTEPASREDLLRDVWDYAADTDTHTIETHIYRLRQKIERDPANPVYLLTNKQGYYLAARANA